MFPRYIVDGLRVYFVGARPYFLPEKGLPIFERCLQNDERTVKTEAFFVNSLGQTEFRHNVIANQYEQKVSKQTYSFEYSI